MLIITLYKNCILNETYQNVFSVSPEHTGVEGTVLENYLNSLSHITFDHIDYVYQENSGIIIIDYTLINTANIYEYNYMKVQTKDENDNILITRYCFINNILLKNELVYLSYSEDIWSSYSDKIVGTTESYLSRARLLRYKNADNISLHQLTDEYKGNNPVSIGTLETINSETRYCIIAEFQYYNKQASGDDTLYKRHTKYVYLKKTSGYHYYWEEIEDMIQRVIYSKSVGRAVLKTTNPYTEYDGYDIGKIYVIPYYLAYQPSQNETRYFIQVKNDQDVWEDIFIADVIYGSNTSTFMTVYQKNIVNNYRRKFIGTFTSPLQVVNNGTDAMLRVYFSKSISDINFCLSFQDKLIDITDDFEYIAPFDALTSEQQSQLKISRELRNSNLKYQKRTEITDMVFDQLNTSTYGFEGTANAILGFKSGNYSQGMNGIATAARATNEIIHKPINSAFKLQWIEDQRKANNAKVYSNTYANFSNSANFMNSKLGLMSLQVQADNTNYVKKSINNNGYEVYEYIDNTRLSNLSINDAIYWNSQTEPIYYNVLRFDTINVYGSFPRSVALALNEILMSGVKIWFDNAMREDNLTVG